MNLLPSLQDCRDGVQEEEGQELRRLQPLRGGGGEGGGLLRRQGGQAGETDW